MPTDSMTTVTPLKDRAKWAQQVTEHDKSDDAPRPPVETPKGPPLRDVGFLIKIRTTMDREELEDIRSEIERGMKILDPDAEVTFNVR